MEKDTLPPLKNEEHTQCAALGAGPADAESAVTSTSSGSVGRRLSGEGGRSGGDGGVVENQQITSKSGSLDTFRPRGESKSQDSVLSSSARARSFGPSPALHGPYGLVSPDFPSLSGTPTSISQLLNLPSSTFSLEGLEFQSPLGSGIISPLTSTHKLGRKRPISISPLSSTSQLDLNSLIRTSSSSLVNCLPTSRENSAGSIGHLSPSLFANPSAYAVPHRAPLFSLRNANHPVPPPTTSSLSGYPTSRGSGSQSEARHNRTGGPNFIKEEPVEESVSSQPSRNDGAMLHFTTNSQESGFNSQPRELETLHEEDVLSEDEMQTDPSNSGNYSSALTEDGEIEDSKDGILDRPRRVYYSYPSVEEPHNNTCRWGNCDAQCQDLNDLVRHVNTDHIYRDSKKEFVCQWSGCVRAKKPFKAQYMLLVHMRRHTGEKPHKCTYEGCNKAYSRLENLKTHLRSHTGERPYVCKYEGCGKAFSNASDCAKHMNRTHSNEKPYACLNPGCTKRYTDPSSRRKHMKNCQVNKKARMEDGNVMSPGDEEGSVETASVISKATTSSSASSARSKKPEKKKPPFGQKMTIKGGPHTGADLGYISGGSQGQPSPLKSYGASGFDGEYHNWQGEDEISTILRHQTLSDPKDPTSPMSVNYPPSTPSAHMASHMVPMDQVSSHVTVNPNGKASRQRGGGLNTPAGQTHGNPPQAQPMKTLHHHPGTLPHPPPSYHQPPLYSQSRPNQFLPSYPSYQSGYSSLPPESRPPQPPSSAPYTHLPASARGERESNPPISNHSSAGNHGDVYDSHLTRKLCGTSSSSGYSSCYSPKGGGNVHRKSPSDDGSVIGAALQNNLMTTSYSTFSSNSSRVSTPSNGGRGDGMHTHHLQQSALHNQFMAPKTSPRGDQAQNFPLEHAMRMPSSYSRSEMSRSSGRSWHYSSQSSQYSYTGSEFSEEAIENLPTDIRRDGFTKTTPLPLPESMQDQFDMPLKMGTGMDLDYSPPQGNGAETAMGDSGPYQHPNSPMQMDFQGDKTMPLYHLPPESGYIPNDTHLPFYSNSQCTTDYDLAYFGASNMVVGDMATISNALPDETECLEKLLSFQTS